MSDDDRIAELLEEAKEQNRRHEEWGRDYSERLRAALEATSGDDYQFNPRKKVAAGLSTDPDAVRRGRRNKPRKDENDDDDND